MACDEGKSLGLRWADVDLKAKTLTVVQARVLVDYKVRIEEPKSHNGKRTLPLDDDLVMALDRPAQAAGSGKRAGGQQLPEPGSPTSTGTPLGTSTSSPTSWASRSTPSGTPTSSAACSSAPGLRKITLHDSRHTTLSLMEKAGMPISIVSKWAGHYDASFTMKTYVHASDEDLKQGRRRSPRSTTSSRSCERL